MYRFDRHPIMTGALISSAAFLVAYVCHHHFHGSTRYPFHDWTYRVYLVVLIPHIILAAVMGPFIIWGAGPGGRLMHDLLLREGTRVEGFLEVHPRRIGGEKRGLPVWPVEEIERRRDAFILAAVGAAGAREQIRGYLLQHDFVEGENFLFVA